MNETTRTLTFVGVAAALAVAAYGMHAANQPPSLEEFSDVGTEFYPDFDNPRDATGLRVAAYNEDAARVDVFNVDFKNGLWRIPSHHDYPADGEERLANTATSIIGLERGALASTSADDHKRLGVLDPLDETITGTEGRGDRITLNKGDQTLADYIIGTRIEDGPENTFHVRRADENRTYRVTLDLDVSTKFADWIEPGLLDFRRGDVRELVIDRYSIDETRGVLVPGATSELSRADQNDPWSLKGLDEKTQKVNTTTVNNMINALEDLKIVGVRRKPAGLSADLRGEGNGAMDGRVVLDLQQKGFFVDARGALVSNEGDVRMATADGAMYVLRFGEVFTGSDVEIEVGNSADDADKSADESGADNDTSGDETADTSEGSDEEASEGDEGENLKKSRYVFITAQFDESVIPPLSEEPVKPEPSAGVDTDTKDEKADDTEADESDEKPADEETDEAKPDDEAAADKPDPKAEYEQALAAYEASLKAWEAEKTAREEQVKAGEQRVQELNERFADWYYVISAETFDKIRVTPEELVEAAEPAEEAADATPPAAPLAAPAAEPAKEEMKDEPASAAKPEEPTADDDKSAETKPADGEKPAASDKPAEDKPAEEKPADDAKPTGSQEDAGKPSEDETAKETPAGDEAADDAS